ncbi:DUF4082 domain-containing protein [Microtetraspora fusca]|uniref:DUF4082 domain-containing protein n=1 Tax=Microtetraspora fusca TaxID=1997 RepID=A0ABW6V4Q4_MICFU
MSASHRDAPPPPPDAAEPAQPAQRAHARTRFLRAVRGRRPLLAAAIAAVLALGAIVILPGAAGAVQAPVTLGSASTYAVLGTTLVRNVNQTSLTGDLGVSPGGSVSGFPPGTVTGTIHINDTSSANARSDATAAYNDIAGRSGAANVNAELGGTTQTPGLYTTSSGNFTITGTLTLDAQSDPDAVFIFRGSTLAAANTSNINLVNGAQENNVFWEFTGNTNFGQYCTFRGNVLTQGTAALGFGASISGRILALSADVQIQGTNNDLPPTLVAVPNNPPTTTTLTVSQNPSAQGQPVTFTATVSAVSGSVVPAGQVAFKDGTTVLAIVFDQSVGSVTYTTSSLPAGQHSITAVYLGGNTPDNEAIIHFAPSKSAPITQVVTASLWDSVATPAVSSTNDPQAVVLGVKFKATTAGTVTGIRFYKGANNTGTHTASLWTIDGRQLATATSSNETGSGWQQVNFPTPVPITPNTAYVASYHTTSGDYSVTRSYFTSARNNDPLIALADGDQGGNGVYAYSATNTFPTNTFQSTNYWVDVVFVSSAGLWSNSTTPAVATQADPQAVVLGVKFKAVVAGTIRGIRFYKGPLNTGIHTATLWTIDGQRLATATFTNETASGWQQANFPTPVPITANTPYVASYFTPSGSYSVTRPYFTSQYSNGSLIAFQDGDQGGNGVYTYSAANAFPTNTYQSTNYWVDVVFDIT